MNGLCSVEYLVTFNMPFSIVTIRSTYVTDNAQNIFFSFKLNEQCPAVDLGFFVVRV